MKSQTFGILVVGMLVITALVAAQQGWLDSATGDEKKTADIEPEETDSTPEAGNNGDEDVQDGTQDAPADPPSEENPAPGTEEEDDSPPDTPELPVEEEENETTWSTFFYVAHDSDIGEWDSWTSNLHFLEMVGPPPGGNLIALVDEELEGDSHILIIGKGGSDVLPTSSIDPSWGSELNMGDPMVLQKFVLWGIENYPASYYNLHMSNHGGAWSGICWDESHSDMLLASEVRESLKTIKDALGRPVDLLSLDACLMGNFEFAYEIREVALYMTSTETYGIGSSASEDQYSTGNWLYDKIWGGLVENPHWHPREFALHQMACFQPIGPFVYPSAGIVKLESCDTFSVVDLSKIGAAKEAFSILIEQMYGNVVGEGALQTAARRQFVLEIIGQPNTPPNSNTDSFSGQMDFVGLGVYCFYDMGDMLARLVEHGGLLCDPSLAQSVLGLYEQAVAGCVSGDDWTLGEHPDATGLTIYVPFRKTEYDVSITNYSKVLFTQETLWDEFMHNISWV